MGESELILDALSVEDVLQLLGAHVKPSSDTQRHRNRMSDMSPSVGDDWRAEMSASIASASVEPGARAASAPIIRELPGWLEALGIPAGITVDDSPPASDALEIAQLPSIEAVAEHIAHCERCSLFKTAQHAVPGEGNPNAELVCVGEAPGANEDAAGKPFVGEAGQLLTKILAAIEMSRDDVFICNVLKHRPPANRDPRPEEVTACRPYLRHQLGLIRPHVILALGRFAAQTLLETSDPLSTLRGRIHRYHGIPVVVTYHPAALLRNESWKRPTWEDVKLARRILDAARLAKLSAPESPSAPSS